MFFSSVISKIFVTNNNQKELEKTLKVTPPKITLFLPGSFLRILKSFYATQSDKLSLVGMYVFLKKLKKLSILPKHYHLFYRQMWSIFKFQLIKRSKNCRQNIPHGLAERKIRNTSDYRLKEVLFLSSITFWYYRANLVYFAKIEKR